MFHMRSVSGVRQENNHESSLSSFLYNLSKIGLDDITESAMSS